MKNNLKTLALTLIAFMILALFSACSGEGGNTKEQDEKNPAQNETANEETSADAAQERLLPELPDMDYEGYDFTFFAHKIDYPGDWIGDGDPRELVAEEEISEPINDAVYKRNRTIEDKYNINIKMITSPDDSGTLKKAVGAGDSLYDAAVIFNNLVPSVVTADLLVNINQLPYIDISRPWWDPAVNSMSIDNKNYLLAGDLLILDNEATNALLFNKDLMANLGIELPYNLVKSGKWTMDAMNDMTKDSAADLNGDGMMKADDDRWGFCVYNDTLHALFVSGGGLLAEKDENDMPYINFTSQKNLLILD
ncbi:MAG: extracellular solute-binding protein, partial [Oscillospiraceae bacterium]|nr:extracellular solute-binding protein [Oscillospiraceae bacterium]